MKKSILFISDIITTYVANKLRYIEKLKLKEKSGKFLNSSNKLKVRQEFGWQKQKDALKICDSNKNKW